MTSLLTVLCCGPAPVLDAASRWGPFALQPCADLGAAAAALGEHAVDALLVGLDDDAALARLLRWPSLGQAVRDCAVVVVAAADVPADAVLQLAAVGVQDLRCQAEDADTLARALRLAVERQRRQARLREVSTDLATGLPHRGQLLEHMTQLLALREREPAPMALLALRLDGLRNAEAALGSVSAQVLRRKAAVRLRAALRASDVVATLDGDSFVVLLAWIDQPADGARVAHKLRQALQQPLRVAGQEVALTAAVGVALYPAQGRDADSLLRVALQDAAETAPLGRGGAAAANDGLA